MMARRRVTALLVAVFVMLGVGSALGFIVTDPATTARNAITAALESRVVEAIVQQRERLRRMAQRLSAQTSLDKYAVHVPTRWGAPGSDPETFPYAAGYLGALTHGDPTGTQFEDVSRARVPADEVLSHLSPAARDTVDRELATLDVADATIIAGTQQDGLLRDSGARELAAIDALERDVTDPSPKQSATAVLDKISGAEVIAAHQKQARLELLTAITEQLLVDTTRSRNTEAAVLNMRLHQFRDRGDDEGGGFMTGAADDLRTWQQP